MCPHDGKEACMLPLFSLTLPAQRRALSNSLVLQTIQGSESSKTTRKGCSTQLPARHDVRCRNGVTCVMPGRQRTSHCNR